MLQCAQCGLTDDGVSYRGLAMPCHVDPQQCIVRLRCKIKEQQVTLDKLAVNGEGEIVNIGDVQWIDGDDGPMALLIEEMVPAHSGRMLIRGSQYGGEESWSSTATWWRTSDCYNTQEALEATKI